MDLETVIAATPPVRELRNERAVFYLRNRELIEEWASVRSEAAREIAERIWDLADPLRSDLKTLGIDDAHVTVHDEGRYLGVSLSRGSWRHAGSSPVSVSLEWDRSAIGSRGEIRVYACVRARQGHPERDAWSSPLALLSDDLKVSLGTGWSRTMPRWITWRYLALPEGPWTSAAVAHTARADLLRLWVCAVPPIDRLSR